MPNSIHLTVATVVERDSTFLMVRETIDGEQVINQPAGHVEPGEDVMAAALRETMEETGWEVAITGFLGFSNAHGCRRSRGGLPRDVPARSWRRCGLCMGGSWQPRGHL